VVAQPPQSSGSDPNGLVSILVLCCGQLEYTRLCVPRLLRHSRPPFELIFVDVGSFDGTTEYLAGVADAAGPRGEVVSVLPDRAFPAAVAEGLARARGAFLVWLNNDVLVPALWLQQMVGLATMDATVGAVGPMSNVAPEQQRIPELPFRLCLRR